MGKTNVAIFASGAGTNMENIAQHVKDGKLDCKIALVVCDQPNAPVLKRAERFKLDTFVVERRDYKFKTQFETAIDQELRLRDVKAIFLAGYMRILGNEFVGDWAGRILNVHPSLLPKHPGVRSIRDAFEAREKETGVTIHFVDEGVDTGPIILQREVPIEPTDSLETLEARVHAMEHRIYPEAIRLFLAGKLKIKDRNVEILS